MSRKLTFEVFELTVVQQGPVAGTEDFLFDEFIMPSGTLILYQQGFVLYVLSDLIKLI